MRSLLSRRLTLIFTGFTAGVFLYQYSPFITLILLPLSLLSLLITGKRGLSLVLAAVMFFLGGAYTSFTERTNIKKSENALFHEGETEGVIISIPEVESYGQSAICKTKFGKIRLMAPDASLSYKDKVTFKGSFYLPDGKSRPFSFDYPLYLKSEGVYIQSFAEEIKVSGNELNYFNPIDLITVFRKSLIDKADVTWDGEALMFAKSILLGDTSYSSDAFREKLSEGSISHIIAVSGTHVSFVSALFFLFIKGFSKRKRYLNLLPIPFIAVFVILTGASPSAVRAAIMASVFLVSKSCLSHYDSFTSLSIGAFSILIFNPFAAFSLSFILSFSAILGIILFTEPFSKLLSFIHLKYVSNILALTLAAQIFTALPLSLSFGRLPFTALSANLPAVPLVPLIMASGYISLAFSFILPAFNLPAVFAEVLMGICLFIADFAGSLPLSGIYPAFGSIVLFVSIFIFLILALFAFFRFRARKTGIIFTVLFIASIALNSIYPIIFPEKSIYFADADHGDATLIFNGNDTVMIECNFTDDDFMDYTLLPILRQHGQKELCALFLSEYDPFSEDVSLLLNGISVEKLYLPEESKNDALYAKAKNCDTEICYISGGEVISFGEITIRAIKAAEGQMSYVAENNGISVLIPGNIPEKAETILSEATPSCDILKAPRHGNKASCSEALLNATNPKAVIISTGRRLSDDFSKRLSSLPTYSTKNCGDIEVCCKDGFKISPYKKVTR